MLDNRDKLEKPLIVNVTESGHYRFVECKCPHCNNKISKSYQLKRFNYCHFCGGKITKGGTYEIY